MERIRKLLDEVETDEDSDFDNEDNGPQDVLEEISSDHESFCERDTDSEDGDSEFEDVNNLKLFPSKGGIEWRKTKCRNTAVGRRFITRANLHKRRNQLLQYSLRSKCVLDLLPVKSYVGGKTSSRWCGAEIWRGGCHLRCCPRHLSLAKSYGAIPK
ncbi:hypothetical protein AVEN_79573-1 [Araneus ventricosus]|uniref:Uncharacterized protein n=1 Tax=Araneus ventricosus TaxID=182803 RepID=A0A4Y2SJ27_ARAVE|nr:hypothetical protein AVEN_79573-1 [Araneus ventricosus]